MSQTVLLRGVNDDAAVLEALFRGLVAMRVKPYYLHHADLARGTAHFRTGIAAGQRLVRSLRGRVSGLCQPTYVLDIPGGYGKVPIAPCAVSGGRGNRRMERRRRRPGCSTLTLPIRRAEEPEVTEPGDPVMIVVGGGAIALSTAQELCALQGHRVVVLWRRDPDFTRAVEGIGAVFIAAARPDSSEALDRAGVRHAMTILALSPDDQLNLHAALLARDANPRIRIVLRQFNRTLAHKIEQNLPNCSVLSLAWHSAATYAAAAIDPSCFRGLQFPEPDGPLTGFAYRSRRKLRRRRRDRRRMPSGCSAPGSCDRRQRPPCPRHRSSRAGAELVVYGESPGLQSTAPRQPAARTRPSARTQAAVAVASRAGTARLGSIRSSSASHWQRSSCSSSAPGTSMPTSEAPGSTPSISWLRR